MENESLMLSNYGKLRYAMEACIKEKSQVITNMNIINDNTSKYNFLNGREKIDIGLHIEDENSYYDCRVQFTTDKNDIILGKIKLPSVTSIQKINNILRAKYTSGQSNLDYCKIYTKDSKESTIDDNTNQFSICIPVIGLDFQISTDLDNKIIANEDNITVVDKDNNCIEYYDTNEFNVTCVDGTEENTNIYVFTKGNDNKIKDHSFHTILNPDKTISPELLALEYAVPSYNGIKITYDEYGIPMDDSKGLVRYEKFYDENDETFLDSIISLHPAYLDMFDTSTNGAKNVWILDQLIFSEVDTEFNTIIYSREVRELSDEENEELSKKVLNASDEYPILEFIDIDSYNDEFETIKKEKPQTLEFLGTTWINTSDLFKDELDSRHLNLKKEFETVVKKSLYEALNNYCYEVATNFTHTDRDEEYIDEVFSADQLFDSLILMDGAIGKNNDTGVYNFQIKIGFLKYVTKAWEKKTMYVINEFEVFGQKMTPHESRTLIKVL